MKRPVFSWILPLALLMVFTLAGCSAKSAATAEQFQKAAEDAGYTVEEQDSGSIVSVQTASKDESSMTFYICNTEDEAKTAVNNLKSNLPTTDNQERVDSSYYSKYSVEDEESYYSVIRMGTTVLACAVDMEDKGSCQQVASALGY